MILVVGGLGAGKREFVQHQLGFAPEQMAPGVDDGRPVVLDLQDIIRQRGDADVSWLESLCEKEVVVCCEVGCGVVPTEAEERRWRDDVGRACAWLARQAQVVVRVVCGVPQIIKGALL